MYITAHQSNETCIVLAGKVVCRLPDGSLIVDHQYGDLQKCWPYGAYCISAAYMGEGKDLLGYYPWESEVEFLSYVADCQDMPAPDFPEHIKRLMKNLARAG